MQKDVLRNYRIAVATKRGEFVDEHFAYAERILVFQGNGKKFQKVETRNIYKDNIIDVISDCDAVLTLPINYYAKSKLLKKNILAIEHSGLIEKGLINAVSELAKNAI